MTKARLFSLLALAVMIAMLVAWGHGDLLHHPVFRPGGMSDGGYW